MDGLTGKISAGTRGGREGSVSGHPCKDPEELTEVRGRDYRLQTYYFLLIPKAEVAGGPDRR